MLTDDQIFRNLCELYRLTTKRTCSVGTFVTIGAALFRQSDDFRAALAERRPSTLGEQIKQAEAQVETWTPERRSNVRLQGSDAFVVSTEEREVEKSCNVSREDPQIRRVREMGVSVRKERHRCCACGRYRIGFWDHALGSRIWRCYSDNCVVY